MKPLVFPSWQCFGATSKWVVKSPYYSHSTDHLLTSPGPHRKETEHSAFSIAGVLSPCRAPALSAWASKTPTHTGPSVPQPFPLQKEEVLWMLLAKTPGSFCPSSPWLMVDAWATFTPHSQSPAYHFPWSPANIGQVWKSLRCVCCQHLLATTYQLFLH